MSGNDQQLYGYDDEDMGGGMDMLDDAGAGADIDSKLMVEHWIKSIITINSVMYQQSLAKNNIITYIFLI